MPGLLVLGERGVGEGGGGVGRQSGCPLTLLHSGSVFRGHQQSKGSKYQVEVVFQVRLHLPNGLPVFCLKVLGWRDSSGKGKVYFVNDLLIRRVEYGIFKSGSSFPLCGKRP